ncbi:MAG: TraR/DksA family transcriptional regulator [Candidatus Omnitrophota bacterium]
MPNRKNFTKKEIKFYRDALIKEKLGLLQGINYLTTETLKKSQREASGDLSGYAYHMADMASDVYERDILFKLAEGERTHLIKIDDALRRIKDGGYGFCEACEKKISKVRLKAVPYAVNCRSCQEKEEKKKF